MRERPGLHLLWKAGDQASALRRPVWTSLAWLAVPALAVPASLYAAMAAPPQPSAAERPGSQPVLPPSHPNAAPKSEWVTPAESTSVPPALQVPVQGVAPNDLRDTYTDQRGGGARVHEAVDIMAPRGTPVLAADDGRIAKLFLSKPGGITIYQFDPRGHFAYYYAHLDGYAEGLSEGQTVHRGQLLGYVGSTGNASSEAPHLHFGVFRLDAEQRWWTGVPINPFPYLRAKDTAKQAP